MAVTLKTIAEKADVSITTVSRVLNNKDSIIPVADETKTKILKIANELNYRPNVNARALSTKKSYNIGLVLDYLDPYFSEIVNSIEKYSRDKNYNLILSLANNKSYESIINTLLYESSVEGVLIGGTKKIINNEVILNKLRNLNIPIVLVAHYYENIPSININDYKGGYIATNHLIELGHKKIGIITGPDFEIRKDSRERFIGYKKALKEANLTIKDKYIYEGNFTYESGYLTTKEILNKSDKPTAIFVSEDQMALGALKAVHDLGYNVPNDLSIIGFDNIKPTEYSIPGLTTIAQPKNQMGEASIRLLIDLIEKKVEKNNYKKLFEPKLIKRESCLKLN